MARDREQERAEYERDMARIISENEARRADKARRDARAAKGGK